MVAEGVEGSDNRCVSRSVGYTRFRCYYRGNLTLSNYTNAIGVRQRRMVWRPVPEGHLRIAQCFSIG